MITKKCTVSDQNFTITESDLDFYVKMEIISKEDYEKLKSREISDCVGLPTLCPEERSRRRLSWRNERKLYQRKCDLCEKMMISMYDNGTKFPVYCQSCWWSDNWDPQNFSREFDFSRPFFEQFKELFNEVPRISLINKEPENSEFCNFSWRNKNSYLLFTCGNCEDSLYNNRSWNSTDICDCSNVTDSELCYEVIDSEKCYNCSFLQNCNGCTDCQFGYGLVGCNNCFMCYNLVKAEYHIANKKYSKEDYFKELEKYQNLGQMKEYFEKQRKHFSRKFLEGVKNENCTGNLLANSKDSLECYEGKNLQDCKYCANLTNERDSYDVNCDDNSELVYEGVGSESNYFSRFNDICWFNKEVTYSSSCMNSEYLFGCVSLKKKQYCILNKEYTKEDYFKLREKIISHMKQTGEWGKFFPTELSPFAYNESVANEYCPMTKEEIIAKNWQYREEKQSFKYDGPKYEIPARIEEVDDEILDKILTCEATGKYYKIQKSELKFYRKMNLPIPRLCPDERHKRRMALRNTRQLFSRNCGKCDCKIQTTFAPDRPEKVLCEKCYLNEIN